MRTLLLVGILTALTFGGTASAEPGAPPPASTDVQSISGTSVRTETATVVENGVLVRIVRVFNNDVLVREVRTPIAAVAGSESAPRASIIVIEERIEPAAVVPIAQLPSTSTAP